VSATAEPNRGPSCQAKGLSFRIDDLKVAFDADGSIVIDRNFRSRHFFSCSN